MVVYTCVLPHRNQSKKRHLAHRSKTNYVIIIIILFAIRQLQVIPQIFYSLEAEPGGTTRPKTRTNKNEIPPALRAGVIPVAQLANGLPGNFAHLTAHDLHTIRPTLLPLSFTYSLPPSHHLP